SAARSRAVRAARRGDGPDGAAGLGRGISGAGGVGAGMRGLLPGRAAPGRSVAYTAADPSRGPGRDRFRALSRSTRGRGAGAGGCGVAEPEGGQAGGPAGLELVLLGGLEVRRGGRPLVGFRSRKAAALLAYLAVSGRPRPRSHLAGLLWGELPEAAAAG